MAQDVKIAGVNYSAVPSIIVPKQNSGNASFFDVSDTTAVASDVTSGKIFYASDGVKTTGTKRVVFYDEFTTPSTSGAYTLNIPYTGNGYMITLQLWIDGGTNATGATWYSKDIGAYTLIKSQFYVAPDYSANSNANYATGTIFYRGTSSWSYTTPSVNVRTYRDVAGEATNSTSALRIRSKNTIGYWVKTAGDTNYGLIPNKKYLYIIGYSE